MAILRQQVVEECTSLAMAPSRAYYIVKLLVIRLAAEQGWEWHQPQVLSYSIAKLQGIVQEAAAVVSLQYGPF